MGKGRKQPGVLRRLLPPGLDHLSSVPFLVASFPRVSSTRLTSSIHSAPAGPVGDRWMEGGNRQVNRPDCYQRLEFFIQVLRVLCPNLTDASLVVCVVSLTRRITRSLCSLVSLREGPDREEGTRPEWGETNRRTAYRSFIHFVRRSSLYASYSRSSFVSAGGHSFPWRSGRRPPVCDAYVMR